MASLLLGFLDLLLLLDYLYHRNPCHDRRVSVFRPDDHSCDSLVEGQEDKQGEEDDAADIGAEGGEVVGKKIPGDS